MDKKSLPSLKDVISSCVESNIKCNYLGVERIDNSNVRMDELETCEGRYSNNYKMFKNIDGEYIKLPPFQLIMGGPGITIKNVRTVFFRCFTKKSIMDEYQKQLIEMPNLMYGIIGPIEQIGDITM